MSDCSSREGHRQRGCGVYTELSTPFRQKLVPEPLEEEPKVPKAGVLRPVLAQGHRDKPQRKETAQHL